MQSQCNLGAVWREAGRSVDPAYLFDSVRKDVAILCVGKAAARTWSAVTGASLTQGALRAKSLRQKHVAPALVISPEPMPAHAAQIRAVRWIQGEHPIPGAGSFEAGRAVVDFFDELRRMHVHELRIYLSGGASSLMWLPQAGCDVAGLRRELEALYRRPWTIQRLNSERAKLCALKGGGAARWLSKLAPEVKAQVYAISDVAPYGPEIIGSGPFWSSAARRPGSRLRHRIVADNSKLVEQVAGSLKRCGDRVTHAQAGLTMGMNDVAERVAARILKDLSLVRGAAALASVWGSEPNLELPSQLPPQSRGGRQTHLAALLALKFLPELAEGRLELLCACSDGVDGRAGAAGALLTGSRLRSKLKILGLDRARRELERAVVRFDSGGLFAQWGVLLPMSRTGTNVQDIVIARVQLAAPNKKGSVA